MIFKRKTSTIIILFILAEFIVAEEHNLFGIPGQGYVVEVNLGHPHQKLNVLVDTGSCSLAVASTPRPDISHYFNADNSTSLYDTGSLLHAKYTEGEWTARLVTDYIEFPSLPMAGEVNSDIALITSAQNFFMDGSGWQGILGLAYPVLAELSPEASGKPWLEAVDKELGQTTSFALKLCGVRSARNATHYGSFSLFDDIKSNKNTNKTYRTPILRERWYEIGILSVRVLHNTYSETNNVLVPTKLSPTIGLANKSSLDDNIGPKEKTCRKLNEVKSIIDSGTTNIVLPDVVYRQVVDDLRNAAKAYNIVLDNFWIHGDAACWPEPREWSLPWLAIDLLSDDDHQYFTIELPPESYMRLVSADSGGGTVSEFCYKLGFESGINTVLGVVAFEGLQVSFDKRAGYIVFQTSDCGPNARISGPHNSSTSLHDLCKLATPTRSRMTYEDEETIRVAQWIVAVALTVAMTLLVYLLAPCVRARCVRTLRRSHARISISRAALVDDGA